MVRINANDSSGGGASSLELKGPNDQLIFSAVPKDEDGNPVGDEFSPEFYPDRFNKVMDKKLNRDGQQCRGEDVTIENFKNADIHATGVCFAHAIQVLEDLHAHDGKVDLYTPISPNGGLEAFVKKIEIGEKDGWNPHADEWMFNYTIDFVSTGLDEYGGDQKNGIVSTLLSEESLPEETQNARDRGSL
jgi:hypothetical protein